MLAPKQLVLTLPASSGNGGGLMLAGTEACNRSSATGAAALVGHGLF